MSTFAEEKRARKDVYFIALEIETALKKRDLAFSMGYPLNVWVRFENLDCPK